MAEALYLVTKSVSNKGQTINGIHAVLINKDDGQTSDQIIASAVAQCNAKFDTGPAPTPFRDGYFDTVTLVSDLTSGVLKDNLDCYIFAPGQPPLGQGTADL